MYAVIASGGKQYRVELGNTIKVESLTAEPGTTIEFEQVLMVANGDNIQIGTPYLSEKVSGEVVSHGRGNKVEIVKFRRRKHHMKHQGHRQNYTAVKITKIGAEALQPKKKAPATQSEEK